MPLILAIEPEREQAALLTTLIRRLSAELVLADTTEQALVAIGDRVPDLVLIPALLSAREDAALAGALRMIAAAAQVQMLTIPFLANPAPTPERRGVLAKWRRGRTASPSLSGCDPAVFADQIAAYLAETDDERAVNTVVGDAAETRAHTSDVAEPAPIDVPLALSDARVTGVEGPALSDALFTGVGGSAAVEAPAASPPASVAAIAAGARRGPATYVPRPFALIDWQHAGDETLVPSDAPSNGVEGLAAGETPLTGVEGLTLSDALFTGIEEPALSDARFTGVEAPAPSDVRVSGVERAIADVRLAGGERPAVADVTDDPMVRAIEQFVAAPIVAEPAIVEKPIAAPIEEIAAAPAPSEPLSTEVEVPALSDVALLGVEGPALSDVILLEVEGPVSSDVLATGLELPMAANAIVEPAPVLQPIADEPIARWGEDATVEEAVVADEPSDKLWIQEPPTEPTPLSVVAEAARVDGWALQAVNEVVASPIVEDAVVVNFDETPVYELSLDELASDAALMASIDAMMAPRVRPGSGVVDQPPGPEPQATGAKPREREEAVVEPVAIPEAEEVLVSRPAAAMPAAENFAPVEWIPQIQTEPDPLFFCDAEPALSPVQGQASREPAAPAAAAATATKSERPEWVELIESLRNDIERLKAERAEPAAAASLYEAPATASLPAAAPIATPPSRTPVASAVRKAKRSKPAPPKTPRPAQDEWGLFDPEQCGFASLLAKLSEITDVNDSGSSSRSLDH